jgi:hypothetical protein
MTFVSVIALTLAAWQRLRQGDGLMPRKVIAL